VTEAVVIWFDGGCLRSRHRRPEHNIGTPATVLTDGDTGL
jgi:hypothetical protein